MRFLTARWVLPMQGDPIENGAVEIEGSVIKNVLTKEEFAKLNPPSQDVTDYGEAIITPGLINLHTHLEYSMLHLLDTDASLFDWIPKLMAHVKTWTPEQFIASATLGARQMVRFGTTCILDSSFSGYAAVGAARAGLRAIVGLEMFSVINDDADIVWERLNARKADLLRRLESGELEGFGEAADAIARGVILLSVAPHAPYTVGPALTKKAMTWAENNNVAWTMHVAESPQERRWIESTDPQRTLNGEDLENLR
jgi:5-methylthioadenosine/S-adenosylhomocysteine deaminase